MIVSFKFYVMNFVNFVLIAIHISPHMYLKFFANFTHYTSYFLLNLVDVIVCVSQSDQPNLQLLWVLVQNIFCVWECKGRMFENLNFGKTEFNTCVLEKHFISYSCILFIIFNALKSFFKKLGYFFQKFYFSRISIDPICFSINRNYI